MTFVPYCIPTEHLGGQVLLKDINAMLGLESITPVDQCKVELSSKLICVIQLQNTIWSKNTNILIK